MCSWARAGGRGRLGVTVTMRKVFMQMVWALTCTCPPTAFPQAPSTEEIRTIEFKAAYFDKDQNRISNNSLPKTVLLKIRLIPGSTFGEVTSLPIASITARIGETTSLDLEQMRLEIERSATTLTPEATKAGLAIAPRATRIARLGTFVYDPETQKGMTSGFRSGARGEAFNLVYFDRPSKLTGVRSQRGMKGTYSVEVKTAGFHFLKAVQETPTGIRVAASAVPQDIYLGITPFGDMRK
jgi:hypothetical protein